MTQGYQKGDYSEVQEASKANRIFGSIKLGDFDRGGSYDPLLDYSDTTVGKKYGSKAEHNWFKNGKCDNTAYVHRQLYRDSGRHKSMIVTKANIAKGKGFRISIPSFYCKKNEQGLYERKEVELTEQEKAKLLIEAELFAKNTLLYKYWSDALDQMFLYGGYYGLRWYANDFQNNTYLKRVKVEPYINMRLGTDRDWIGNEFQSIYHYLSCDFESAKGSKSVTYKEYENKKGNVAYILADDGMIYQEKQFGTYSKFVGNVTDYRSYYATPDYESRSALNDICTDYELSQYDLKSLKEGFMLDHIIIIYRSREKDDGKENKRKKDDVNNIKGSFKGSGASRTSVMWAEPERDGNGGVVTPELIKVIEIPHDTNIDRYAKVRQSSNAGIMNAHGISLEEIASLPSTSSKGLSNQSSMIITGLKMLNFQRINPFRQKLIEDIQDIFIDAGYPVNVEAINSIPSFRDATDAILKMDYTANERRAIFGDKPLTESQKEEIARTTVKEINEL